MRLAAAKLRWSLAGLCALVAAASMWAAPVPTDSEAFLDDLAAGRVSQASANCPGDRGVPGLTLRYGRAPAAEEPMLCWTNSFGWTRQASVAEVLGYVDRNLGFPTGNLLVDDTEDTVRATADDLGTEVELVTELTVQKWYRLLVEPSIFLLLIGTTVVVFAGQQPRRFTKWGTFWIAAVVPMTLGMLWWLLYEWPWSHRATAAAEPGARQRGAVSGSDIRRYGGGTAALVAVAAVVVINAAALGVGALLDVTPTADPADWVVVGGNQGD